MMDREPIMKPMAMRHTASISRLIITIKHMEILTSSTAMVTESLMDCMMRVRSAAVVGGVIAAGLNTPIDLDRLFPYSPMVHHALFGVIGEAIGGQGIRMPIMMSAPYVDQKAALEIACAGATGVLAGMATDRVGIKV